ncbi:putative benzoate 4-monooxygenase cytochrome p450 [Neofusicoccum parvum]|nr:putative benzoate 4-monooxygenase cytochrome p450 [Neofusicoccum parvum]
MFSSPMLLDPLPAALAAAAVGVSLHLCLFIRGEWERHVPILLAIVITGPIMLNVLLLVIYNLSLARAIVTTILLVGSLNAGLFTSITTYRLFFHPLNKFPGPVGARITGFWSIWQSIRTDYKWHLKVQQLHEEYGDFVRIRPREISINHPDAVHDIYGLTTKCSKGPFYDINYPARSLQMTRDKKVHSQRRRTWDKAFTAKALESYETRLQSHCDDLCAQLASSNSTPINATDLCEFFGYDVMSDLLFSASFHQLRSSTASFVLNQFKYGRALCTLLCVPWLFRLIQTLPMIKRLRTNWIAWCVHQLETRLATPPPTPDLITHLTAPTPPHPPIPPTSPLAFDAEAAIVAGADTTASALAACLHLLAAHPAAQSALRAELARIGALSHQQLAAAPCLDGVLREALRLYPPVPSGLQRVTPAGGAVLAGRRVPGDVLVSAAAWCTHRDPRNFTRPDEFLPERWMGERRGAVGGKEAWAPFSVGMQACVGRPLAMMELRMAVANVVARFEVKLEDEVRSVEVFEKDPGWRDFFIAAVPPVRTVFVERK